MSDVDMSTCHLKHAWGGQHPLPPSNQHLIQEYCRRESVSLQKGQQCQLAPVSDCLFRYMCSESNTGAQQAEPQPEQGAPSRGGSHRLLRPPGRYAAP